MRLYASFYAGLQSLIAQRRATHAVGTLDVFLTAQVMESINVSLIRDTRCRFHFHKADDVYRVLVSGGVKSLQRGGHDWKTVGPDSLHGELVNEPSVLEELDEAVR